MMKTFYLLFLVCSFVACGKPSSGIVQEKIYDGEKKIVIKWSSGPNSEGTVPGAYWLKLDTGTVRVSSNEWRSVQIGDHWPKN